MCLDTFFLEHDVKEVLGLYTWASRAQRPTRQSVRAGMTEVKQHLPEDDRGA